MAKADKGFFSRLRQGARDVAKGVREFFRPPSPPPRRGAAKSGPARELDEIQRLIAAQEWNEAEDRLLDFIRRHPKGTRFYPRAARMLEQVRQMRQMDLFADEAERELDEDVPEDADERDAHLEDVRRRSTLNALRETGVREEIVEKIEAVPDWDAHYLFTVDHNGLISDPQPGQDAAPRTDTFVGPMRDLTNRLLFWAEQGEVFGVSMAPLAREVDIWRPLYENETIDTIRGTKQGRGKRKPKRKVGRPAKRRGQYTSAEWEARQKTERQRKYRARKSAEKAEKIRAEQGDAAADKYLRIVETRRRAANKRKKK